MNKLSLHHELALHFLKQNCDFFWNVHINIYTIYNITLLGGSTIHVRLLIVVRYYILAITIHKHMCHTLVIENV